jgi:hypothetical protein
MSMLIELDEAALLFKLLGRCCSTTGYVSPSSCCPRLGEVGELWGSSDLALNLLSRCTGEAFGDIPLLGVVLPLVNPSNPASRSFVFSLALLRHFINALAICSSNMVFFMFEPICIVHKDGFGCDNMLLSAYSSVSREFYGYLYRWLFYLCD